MYWFACVSHHTRVDGIVSDKPAAERFESLILSHYRALFRAAYRMTRSVADAEDLVQEVCVRSFPRLDELEALDKPRHWLMRVLYRLVIDKSRRFERRHVESLDVDGADELVSPDLDPAEQSDVLRERERLDRAWRRLTDDERILLALHDVEGYSLAELNLMLGLKEGTMKSRLHRARVRLGKLLRGEERPVSLEVVVGETQ